MSDQVNVGNGEDLPTHHFSLTGKDNDGVTHKIGFIGCDRNGSPTGLSFSEVPTPATVMRISQGAGGYGEFEQPYTPMVQRDWSGGRGLEDFDEDVTRYTDGYRIDTRRGDLICGPKATPTTGIETVIDTTAGAVTDATLMYVACSFTVSTTMIVREVTISFGMMTWLVGANCYILPNVGGVPGSPAVSGGGSDSPPEIDGNGGPMDVSFHFDGCALAPGTYWLKFTTNAGDFDLMSRAEPGQKIMWDSMGWKLLADNKTFAYRMTTISDGQPTFFEYRGSLFAVLTSDDQTAPRLYLNGYHGMANATGSDKYSLEDYDSNFPNQGLSDKIVKIVSGPGVEEETNWRLINFNTTTELTSLSRWNIPHTTATEFAVLGCDTWTEITGHGLTKPVTSVLVVDDIVYFAQGDSTSIRRGRYSAGAWSWAWDGGTDASNGNKATHLSLIADKQGVRKIWRTQPLIGMVSSADVKPWGTALVFGTAIPLYSSDARIRNMIAYGSPIMPYILKEDGMGSIDEGVWAKIPLHEMAAVRSEHNGKAAVQFGVYLFFSLLDGVERYYQGKLDDLGPNRDLGLPPERSGPIYHMVAYPTGVLACVDGGDEGISSVLFWNQTGWCELYRAPVRKRIRSAHIQVIPGTENPDRLWVGQGEEIIWLPIALNPLKQPDYRYFSGSSIDSARMAGSLKEIVKFWGTFKLFSENLAPGEQWVEVEYRTDENPYWQPIKDSNGAALVFDQSPSQQLDLSPNFDVIGRWFQYRLTLKTTVEVRTPRVKSVVIDAVTRIPAKQAWNVVFYIADEWTNLNGDQLNEAAKEYTERLRRMTDSRYHAAPMVLNHEVPMFDGLRVFVEPQSLKPIEIIVSPDRSVRLVGSMTLRAA